MAIYKDVQHMSKPQKAVANATICDIMRKYPMSYRETFTDNSYSSIALVIFYVNAVEF